MPIGSAGIMAVTPEMEQSFAPKVEVDNKIFINTWLIVDHTNFAVANPQGDRVNSIKEVVDNNPNNIYIFWNSSSADVNKEQYQARDNESLKNLCKSKNFLLFSAWTNIRKTYPGFGII